MHQLGVRSLGVAVVITTFTGMVLALQSALSLSSLGIKYYVGTLVSKSLVRELGRCSRPWWGGAASVPA